MSDSTDTPSRGFKSLLAFCTDDGASAISAIGSLTNTGTLFTTQHKALLKEFVNETIGLEQAVIDASGIRGQMGHIDTRTRHGVRVVAGQIVMQPSVQDLYDLVPIWFGGSSASPALQETGPASFGLAISRDAKDFYYNYCKVARVNLTSASGGILTMTLTIIGTDENVPGAGSVDGVPFAADTISGRSLTAPVAQSPLMHFDTSAGVLFDRSGANFAGNPEGISITIDHGIMPDRFRNKKTVSALPAMDRVVSVELGFPYSTRNAAAAAANTTLYPAQLAGYGSTNAGDFRVQYAHGDIASKSVTFDFIVTKFNRSAPRVGNSRGEIMLPYTGRAFRTASTQECVLTLDIT